MKIGDKVVMSASYKAAHPSDSYRNDVCTVSKIGSGMFPVEITYPDGAKGICRYDELELVNEKENLMSNTNVAMIVNSTGATVVIGSAVHTIAKDHPNFEAIQEAYAEGRVSDLETLVSVRKAIEAFAAGTNIRIENGKLFYGDRELKTGLARRIIKLMQEGKDAFAKPLVAFMENVMLNPSFRAVEGLYEWLERSNLPITPDGHFIAWKIVGPNFMDCYTGKFDNSPGKVVEVARNAVDEDPNRTCSNGLHFCSNEYLPHYGGNGRRIVMVKINPKDVGAFPHDYNISKGRCCRYEVLQEVTEAETETKFAGGSGLYNDKQKKVARLDTRNDRAEITLVFTDGTRQVTKNRLGDTTTFNQVGNTVTLLPSGRTIQIN